MWFRTKVSTLFKSSVILLTAIRVSDESGRGSSPVKFTGYWLLNKLKPWQTDDKYRGQRAWLEFVEFFSLMSHRSASNRKGHDSSWHVASNWRYFEAKSKTAFPPKRWWILTHTTPRHPGFEHLSISRDEFSQLNGRYYKIVGILVKESIYEMKSLFKKFQDLPKSSTN